MTPQREDNPDKLWETIERLVYEKGEIEQELEMFRAYIKVQRMIFRSDDEQTLEVNQ